MAEKLNTQLRHWSAWSRILAIGIGVAVAFYLVGSFETATADARADMRSALDAISNESAAVTNEYLAGSETAARVISGMTAQIADDPALEQSLYANLIKATPQIEAVFVGYPDGTFSFVARTNVDGADFRIRKIEGAELVMTESFTTSELEPLRSQTLPESTYDPRERSWFGPIADGATTNWSDPYVFASSGKLGVTYSIGVFDPQGELAAVVGVDLTLDDLVAFLKDRRPSTNGSAQVLNNQGRVLASSSTDVIAMQQDPTAIGADMSWAASALQQASAGYDESPAPDAGHFTVGESRGTVRPVGGDGNWFLLVEAPERDFDAHPKGWLSNTTLQVALWSLLTVALVFVVLRTVGGRVVRLNRMATVDELTGLPNRSGIFRALRNTLEGTNESRPVVVAILDLDSFKAVNDSHGHAVGDATLASAAHHIATICDRNDMSCGRLGGDEFVVYGHTASDQRSAHVWREISSAIESMSSVNGAPIDLGASIGVAVFADSTPIEVTAALHSADRALYAAKRSGGNRTVFAADCIDGQLDVVTALDLTYLDPAEFADR